MASGLDEAWAGPPVFIGATLFPGLQESTDGICYAAEQNLDWRPIQESSEILGLNITPQFGTPTHHAVRFGLNRLRGVDYAKSDRHLILITDGAGNQGIGPSGEIGANCTGDGENAVDADPMLAEVEAAYRDEQILTWVIGLPGSSNSYGNVLDRMAVLGGTADPDCEQDPGFYCHLNYDPGYDYDFREDLTNLMGWFSYVMTNCAFRLPPGATASGEVDLRLDLGSETRSLGLNPGCPDGQGYLVTDDKTHVVLCEDSCAAMRSEPSKVVATRTCP